ncbi:MAG: aspartyl protease family protein, partial [Fimbriimonadales bacterium]|nr:aspartyl protease family protein [Fimbriimonadales bacterium]
MALLREPTGEVAKSERNLSAVPRWGYCGCVAALTAMLLLSLAANGLLIWGVLHQRKLLVQFRQPKSLPVTIPIEYSSSGHPMVPVEVNGETFWWLLDTGAEGTVVFAERFPVSRAVRPVEGKATARYSLLGISVQGSRGVVDD